MDYCRLGIYAILLALFSASVLSAEEKVVFDKDFFTDDSFTVGQKTYIVNVDTYERVIINDGNEYIIVPNMDCKTSEYVKFCVEEIDYKTERNERFAHMKVYTTGPDITVTRTLSKGSFLVGEEVEVNVLIKNNGGSAAENLTYVDTFPTDILIIDTEGGITIEPGIFVWQNGSSEIWQNGSSLRWNGRINKGGTEEFGYTLKATKPIDKSFKAMLTYFDGVEFEESFVSSINIKADYFFKIESKYSEKDYVPKKKADIVKGTSISRIQVGDDGQKLIIRLTNRDEESIEVLNLDFSFSEGMELGDNSFVRTDEGIVYSLPLTKINSRLYRWRGTVTNDAIFIFTVRPTLTGDQAVTMLGKFKEDDGITEDYYSSAKIEAELQELHIESSFKADDHFDSEQRKLFDVYIQNPNDDVDLIDLSIKLNIPWINENRLYLERLDKFSYKTVVEGVVTLPKVNKTTAFPFVVNVSYKTAYGEEFSEEMKRNVVVEPPKMIEVTTGVDSSLEDGDEATVTVSIKNNGNEDIIGANITSMPDPELNMLGPFSRTVNIKKKSSIDAFTYKIKAPYVGNITKFKIITTADYEKNGIVYSSSDEAPVSVNPPKVRLKVTPEISEKPVFMGGIFNVDYTVTNNYDYAVKNITFYFSGQKELDIVGSRMYRINTIAAKQTVFLNDIEQIRPKLNGTIRLEKADVEFANPGGNVISAESSTISFNAEHGAVTGPAVIVEKDVPSKIVNTTNEFEVMLKIKNIGDQPANVTLKDLDKSWVILLEKGGQEAISYKMSQSTAGKIKLPSATADYSYEGTVYHTASVQPEVRVIEPQARPAAKEEAKPMPEAQVFVEEEGFRFNINYLYLFLSVGLVAFIIILVIVSRRKQKKRIRIQV